MGWCWFLADDAGTNGIAEFVGQLSLYLMLSFAGFFNGLFAFALACAAAMTAAGRLRPATWFGGLDRSVEPGTRAWSNS